MAPKTNEKYSGWAELSAISEMHQNLKESVASLGLEFGRVCSPRIESNMTNAEKKKENSIDESIPVEDLLVLEGSLDGCRVRIVKDDACNKILFHMNFPNAL